MAEEMSLLVSQDGPVAILRLNRPEVLNSLNRALVERLVAELERLDVDPAVLAIVITGDERAFAAGADIGEMADESAIDMLIRDQFTVWDRIRAVRKPLIAAVSGYVLGGGAELMMSCDLVVASESARIGQPEIRLGVMPGAGGTQRLTRALGTRRALELLWTGEPIDAEEAYRAGLVNRIAPAERVLPEALALARTIASMPPLAVRLIKRAVYLAEEAPLDVGLQFERHAFYLLFASNDQKEGMRAFLEKRPPQFRGR
ncbi:MAG: enoyl-CoA hydratase/isomerase family protein [Hydrogenibacillus schlegelii]|uniref:Enoyl-CoA hydratase/isomerase family protein n=1 Tax=Hydrogenibacillus schlegelii TaxID=1484 RepID=A0A947GH27_HYDSH|nr:enoyl-CoA hydratase/isomerase family protein [Hydrogenibacillus schlegelii]